MTEDETVNGPKIAAQILSRMPPALQKRLMQSINARDTKLAASISQNMVVFEDLATLTPQSIQVLIKNIDHLDLVNSLRQASAKARTALLENMSERRRQVVLEDYSARTTTSSEEIEAAQKRIVSKMDELLTAGLIRSL